MYNIDDIFKGINYSGVGNRYNPLPLYIYIVPFKKPKKFPVHYVINLTFDGSLISQKSNGVTAR